jgi:alginate O-acetyltransferase complex protein AlgI
MTIFIGIVGLVNYSAGVILSRWKSRTVIFLTISVDLVALGYYKYANFFIETFNMAVRSHVFSTLTYLVIPLGISFFTFELIHYVVDVYQEKKPVKNVIDFFTFLFFFPTLIAGPIKRFEQFIPQLYEKKVNYLLIHDGLLLLIRGLFKKILIADTLSHFANYGFNATSNPTVILIGIYAFSFQIYFDFSGYTDIARGAAALLGIKIPENFHAPYMATSIQDFWRRWHISLMEWFKDYVYIPLGGSRKGLYHTLRNTLVVFLLSGVWHGAGWHFILWGAYHGVLVSLYHFLKYKNRLIKLPVLLGQILTFHLVTFGWILFRVSTIGNFLQILERLVSPSQYKFISSPIFYHLLFIMLVLVTYACSIGVMKKISYKNFYQPVRYFAYGFGLLLVFLSIATTGAPFIYFQF